MAVSEDSIRGLLLELARERQRERELYEMQQRTAQPERRGARPARARLSSPGFGSTNSTGRTPPNGPHGDGEKVSGLVRHHVCRLAARRAV